MVSNTLCGIGDLIASAHKYMTYIFVNLRIENKNYLEFDILGSFLNVDQSRLTATIVGGPLD